MFHRVWAAALLLISCGVIGPLAQAQEATLPGLAWHAEQASSVYDYGLGPFGYENRFYNPFKIKDYATPQEACDDALLYVHNYQFGIKPGSERLGDFETAISYPLYGPREGEVVVVPGYRCQYYHTFPNEDEVPENVKDAELDQYGWDTKTAVVIRPHCIDKSAPQLVGDTFQCPPVAAPVAKESQDSSCSLGDSPFGALPPVLVGNPILVDSGAKVAQETDYRSADGLLTVERQYKSRPRNPLYVKTALEIPGFSLRWRGVLPGVINVAGENATHFAYHAPNGTVRRFRVNESAPGCSPSAPMA